VDALFVGACGVAGALVGAILDPVAQQLADRSRAAEERDRAQRDAVRAERERSAAGPDPRGVGAADGDCGDTGPRTVPELVVDGPAAVPVVVPGSDDGSADVRHLLPSGRAPARTVGAALVTGVLWAALAHQFGPHLLVTPFLVFEALAVAVSVTDLSHRLVPRTLLYGSLVLIAPLLVIVSAVDGTWHDLVIAVVGGAVAFVVFFVIWFAMPRGMGFGDVRLAGVIGLTVGYLGLVHVYLAFLSGFVIGLLFGLALMVGSSAGRKTRIPFAPALCIGAVIAILWGGTLAHDLFHASS